MKQKVEKILFCILAGTILLSFLGGIFQAADTEKAEENAVTLWVVTERSNSDGMNYQAEQIAQWMEEQYAGLTIELELLPTEESERENRLRQLQSQIMAGGGPDVYLLPTGGVLTMDSPKEGTVVRVEALFPDVQQAMYSGLFQDVSAYYDADEALGKEALKTEILDAGCIGESRYVLPLRFDMDLILTEETNWAASGMDPAVLEASIDVLAQEVMGHDATGIGAYTLRLPADLHGLPQIFDYEKGELLITQQNIADYMTLYQSWTAAVSKIQQTQGEVWSESMYQAADQIYKTFLGYPTATSYAFNNLDSYNGYKTHWIPYGFPLYTTTMKYLMDSTIMCTRLGENFTVYPLRDADGKTTASITYYGAVGGGCEQPELAYEFLRQFLTEEYQWDLYRPRVKKTTDPMDHEETDPQRGILVEESWPVRTVGSAESLWDNRKYQLFHYYGNRVRIFALQSRVLTDTDLPILDTDIEKVLFPIALSKEESLDYALSQLNDENGAPTDVNIDELAQQVLQNLWWHLAEG